eukprot:scaffold67560_cov31-Tisochrysis_lutea.AAC.4
MQCTCVIRRRDQCDVRAGGTYGGRGTGHRGGGTVGRDGRVRSTGGRSGRRSPTGMTTAGSSTQAAAQAPPTAAAAAPVGTRKLSCPM